MSPVGILFSFMAAIASNIAATATLSSAPRIVFLSLFLTSPFSITGTISPFTSTVSTCAAKKIGLPGDGFFDLCIAIIFPELLP